jgi:hypothetical protein
VFALTATATQDEENKTVRAGFNGYLTKPLDLQALLAELARYLTVKEQKRVVVSQEEGSIDFLPQQLERLPELCGLLQAEILPVWETLHGAMVMDDIEAFADRLHVIGNEYKAQGVIRYAEHLKTWAQEFDILQIEAMLQEFPDLIQALDDRKENEREA